jgi:hypothetical protein
MRLYTCRVSAEIEIAMDEGALSLEELEELVKSEMFTSRIDPKEITVELIDTSYADPLR